MEENNLNLVPTEQELINAGFEQSRRTGIDYYYFSYSKKINDNLIIIVEGSDTGIWYKNENKAKLIHPIEATKAAINKEFEHFNQPLPQWEKPKPKVGEVWKNGKTVYLINDTVLKATSRVTIVSDNDLETGTIVNIVSYGLTKVADTLEDYYKEKFLQVKPKKSSEKILVARKLWTDFGNISVDCNGDILEDFKPVGQNIVFEIGTDKKEVWHWFEETFNLSVAADLMYPKKKI